MRSEIPETVTTPEQALKATSFALGVLMQATAREIASGRMEMSDVSPTLELMEKVAAPDHVLALNLGEMRREWNREKMADVDVVADLRELARRMGAAPLSGRMPTSKGPADVEAPMASPDRGAGR